VKGPSGAKNRALRLRSAPQGSLALSWLGHRC